MLIYRKYHALVIKNLGMHLTQVSTKCGFNNEMLPRLCEPEGRGNLLCLKSR